MKIKQKIPAHIQLIINQIDAQIDSHKKIIEALEIAKEFHLMEMPETPRIFPKNVPLTRELIRQYFSVSKKPVQTVEIIDLLYPEIGVLQRGKLIKTLSVIFNQMAEEGEIKIEKKQGVKGNFYTYINK